MRRHLPTLPVHQRVLAWRPIRQQGFLLITSVVLIVVAALLLTVMVFLGVTGNESSVGHSQSGQALFVAESGIEYEQRQLARNLDWYRSPSDPFDLTTRNLGRGSFTVQANLPATILRNRISTAGAIASIRVYSTDRFPIPPACSPCYVQVGDDITGGAEYMSYTGTSGGDTFTGITRNVTIGGITGTAAIRPRGEQVYPVTILSANMVNSCAAPTSFNVGAHSKFLGAGTVDIEGEEISYTGSTTAGGVMTLTGVSRCQNGTTSAAHNAGRPVTSLLVDGSDPDYEAEVFSDGTVAGTVRRARKTVQR